MSMRRTIGISFACFVTTTCAIGNASEESTSHHRGETTGLRQAKGETPTGESRISAGGLFPTEGSPTITALQMEQPFASFEPATETCGGIPDPCCSSLRPTGITLSGKSCLVQPRGPAHRQRRASRYRYCHGSASHASAGLLRKSDEPPELPLCCRQDKRSGSIHSRTHSRPLAACCRCTRYETLRSRGGRR
jgi:hypothetical protein